MCASRHESPTLLRMLSIAPATTSPIKKLPLPPPLLFVSIVVFQLVGVVICGVIISIAIVGWGQGKTIGSISIPHWDEVIVANVGTDALCGFGPCTSNRKAESQERAR
jgi:hypothetical protein